MSRIGKKPVILPSGVTAELNNSSLTIKSGKGTLVLEVHPKVQFIISENEIIIDVVKKEDKREKALWGLYRSLVQNMVEGLTNGYSKVLDVVGVGFKAEMRGAVLVLHLGFSHAIEMPIAEGVEVKIEKQPAKVSIPQYQTTITLSSVDKQLVGQVAANIRELKKPEPYKGKGIRYSDENILRKAGKVVKAIGK
jgi:large subunit ribosomal protein L6